MTKYAAILFDLDGTLADTIAIYEKAVLQSMAEIGVKVTEEKFYDWYVRGIHLKQILAEFGLTEDKVPSVRARRDELYVSLLRTDVMWLPGGEELLKETAGKKPTAIVTGSWMSYVDAIDERLHVKRYVPTIITADEIHKFMKPHPHGLLLAADRLKVDPKDCLYVGDQLFDTEAAHRADMPCCIVPGKYSPPNVGEGADFVCKTLADISKIIA